jgi:hypothetical protein
MKQDVPPSRGGLGEGDIGKRTMIRRKLQMTKKKTEAEHEGLGHAKTRTEQTLKTRLLVYHNQCGLEDPCGCQVC